MGYSLIKDFANLGIKIELTSEGVNVLTKIMKEGCPVKFDNKYPTPIACQLEWSGRTSSCESCWRSYLKKFIKKEN